jgi:hypothetical protein
MLRRLTNSLVSVLDGRNDLIDRDPDASHEYTRKTYQASTKPIVQCKLAILDIFHTVMDLRDNYRMMMMLSIFREAYENGHYSGAAKKESSISFHEIHQILQNSTNAVLELANLGQTMAAMEKETEASARAHDESHHGQKSKKLTKKQKSAKHPVLTKFPNVFKFFELRANNEPDDIPKEKSDLISITRDLTDYGHGPLAAKAFQFLLSNFSQQRYMHDLMKKVVIIADGENHDAFEKAEEICARFRSKVRFAMGVKEANDMIDMAKQVVELCDVKGE